MLKHLTAVFAAFALICAPAHAALVDFASEADTNGERGIPALSNIVIDGVPLFMFGFQGIPNGGGPINGAEASPYFDAGNAGLGVCKVLDSADQCTSSADANVGAEEMVGWSVFEDDTFAARRAFDITGLSFRDADSNLIDASNDGLIRIFAFYENGTGNDMTSTFTAFMNMAMMGDAFFQNLTQIQFYFENKEFYISSVDISDVPIPGAMLLLLSGVAGLGFASRRKKPA